MPRRKQINRSIVLKKFQSTLVHFTRGLSAHNFFSKRQFFFSTLHEAKVKFNLSIPNLLKTVASFFTLSRALKKLIFNFRGNDLLPKKFRSRRKFTEDGKRLKGVVWDFFLIPFSLYDVKAGNFSSFIFIQPFETPLIKLSDTHKALCTILLTSGVSFIISIR